MWDKLKLQSRKRLDARFTAMPDAEVFLPPPKGWAKAIREALGMTTRQLGRRLGKTSQTILELERSEAEGRIQLNSLAKLAEGLDCRLVYALIPNTPQQSLQEALDNRARAIVLRAVLALEHTMALEDQQPDGSREARIRQYIADLCDERMVWDKA